MPYRDDLNILKYNQGVILLHTLATDSLFCGEFSAEHNFIKKIIHKIFLFFKMFFCKLQKNQMVFVSKRRFCAFLTNIHKEKCFFK